MTKVIRDWILYTIGLYINAELTTTIFQMLFLFQKLSSGCPDLADMYYVVLFRYVSFQ